MFGKKRFLLICSLLSTVLLMAGCHDDDEVTVPDPEPAASAWNKYFMDLGVKPGEDFYRYALGGWMEYYRNAGNELIFQDLIARNDINWIYAELMNDYAAGNGRLDPVIKAEYEILTDAATREAGVNDIREKVASLLASRSREELIDQAVILGQTGYLLLWTTQAEVKDRIGINLIFPDMTTPGMNYEDPGMRDAYLAHAEQVLGMLGAASGQEARRIAENALESERQMTQTWTDGLDDGYFADYCSKMLFYGNNDIILTTHSQPFFGLAHLFNRGNEDMLRDYLVWSLVRLNEDFLSFDILDVSNAFRRRLGQEEKDVYDLAWDQVTELYKRELNRDVCDRLTRPGLTEAYTKMTKEIFAVMRERIEKADWIKDTSTREEALRKLDRIEVYMMGKKIDTRAAASGESALACTTRMRRAAREEKMSLRGIYISNEKNVELFSNELQYNVSAFSQYLALNVSAGVFTESVLPRLEDTAFLYGYLGGVMAHELLHNFDTVGREYDSTGELRDWWTEADAASYNERARKVSDYYSTLSYEGYQVNGEQVLGECVSELGGLSVAFEAMKRATGEAALYDADGFTAAQRFFFGYAWYYAEMFSGEYKEIYVEEFLQDEHVYPPLCVTSTCANTDGWYEAFPEVQPGDKWYIAPEKRVGVW